jgi:transposase
LLHDNARPHSSKQTTQKLASLGYTVLTYPPYYPDLAPSDYALFNKMKEPLRRRKSPTSDNLERGVHDFASSILKGWYAAAIQKLPERWKWCIDLGG